jgi:RimJ/RimL family protein N-acetyltransferase
MTAFTPVVLATERLRLRWMDKNDIAAQYAIFSDPEVTRYWSVGAWTSIEQSREAYERAVADYRDGTGLRFAMELAGQPGMIGSVTLHKFADQGRRCEIGYALARPYWRQGYVAEAVRAVVEHGFSALGLRRIEADVDPCNMPSARILERLGFRKEGFMPERWTVNGEPADTVFYGLLKSYWTQV